MSRVLVEVMTTTELNEWVLALRRDLARLRTLDSRYGLDLNELLPPASEEATGIPVELAKLFRACDGLSLPNVYNGYFIDPAIRVQSAAARGEPGMIVGNSDMSVHVFGSDGGGGRFALGLGDGAVYYLPSWGGVYDGQFIEDSVTRVRKVADSVMEFLWRLHQDVHAFVERNQGHTYMSDS